MEGSGSYMRGYIRVGEIESYLLKFILIVIYSNKYIELYVVDIIHVSRRLTFQKVPKSYITVSIDRTISL